MMQLRLLMSLIVLPFDNSIYKHYQTVKMDGNMYIVLNFVFVKIYVYRVRMLRLFHPA